MQVLFSLALFFFSQWASAVDATPNEVELQNFKVYSDVKKLLSPDNVVASQKLKPENSQSFVTGYFSGNVWIYYEVHNLTSKPITKIVSVDYPLIDEVDLYEVSQGKLVNPLFTGLRRGRNSREIDSTQFGRLETFKPNQNKSFLMRASGSTSMSFPILISDPQIFYKHENAKDFIFGIYIGLILLIALYNAAIGLAARDINHIYYLFAVIFFHGFGVLTLFGYPSRYFWPESTWLVTRQYSLSEGMASTLSAIFCYSFLNIKEYLPKVRKIFFGIMAWGILITLYGAFHENIISLALSAFTAVVASFFTMGLGGYLAFFKKSRSARFFFAAWTVFCSSMLAFLFKYLGIIGNNNLTTYSVLVGAAVEALILSYALGDKIKRIGEERFEGQKKALATITMAKAEQDNFIANTSHELRTPVGVILGLADAILRHDEIPAKIRSNARMIRVNASRLHDLVSDLLTVGRLKQMKVRIAKSSLDLNMIISATLEMFRSSIENKNLSLKFEKNNSLPLVLGDQRRIEQILINLLDNAITFSDKGTITIITEIQESYVKVSVKDEGIGIQQCEFENIFIPFKQLDSGAERKNGGLGLGLHIVKDLVELQGGQVAVASELGNGSTFSFTLETSKSPMVENKIEGNNESLTGKLPIQLEDEMPNDAPAFRFDGETRAKILAVDDDAGNRLLLQQIFPSDKFEVKVVSSATAVLNHLDTSWQPDLVIIDLMMPKVSGITLTKKLRERYNEFELPIVLLTAKATVDAMVEGFAAGANEFITKPLNAVEVISRVNKHVQLASLSKAVSLFVPPGLISLFDVKRITELKLGTFRNLNKVVLFADIRNFSSLVEHLKDEDLYGFTLHYFLQMTPIVRKYNGFIDKFIGDGIMAIFETPDECVKCAIEMIEHLPEYNKARLERNRIPINMGIGIHSGNVVAGIIGDPERLEATILGDKVNTASRLEQITKTYAVDIIASRDVIDSLGSNISAKVRFVDVVKLYGKEDSIEIFEIAKMSDIAKFFDSHVLRDIRKFVSDKKYKEALSTLAPLLEHFPTDPIVKFYFDIAKSGLEGNVIPIDSNGVHVFLKKAG